jgi:hypothetical protein
MSESRNITRVGYSLKTRNNLIQVFHEKFLFILKINFSNLNLSTELLNYYIDLEIISEVHRFRKKNNW